MCLFYDRVFLHDYFGVFICVDSKGSYDSFQGLDEALLRYSWSVAGGLDEETKTYFRTATNSPFEGFVLKGVAQGLGFNTGRFSPTFVIQFAKEFSSFLHDTHELFNDQVLSFCQTSENPYLPSARLEGGVKVDLRCADAENEASLSQSVQNNKHACLFEQEYHKLPLISDSEEDLVRWDRAKDLLTTALLLAAIPSRVPTIGKITGEQILEIREKLKDSLPPFRKAMLNSAWEIAKAAREASLAEVESLARLYYSTQIEPSLTEIEGKLKSENARLRHKLLERGIDKTVLLAKAIDPTEPLSKWELLGSGLKSLLDVDETNKHKHEIKSPYEFLIKLPSVVRNLSSE
jgi:hypothetical protein